MSSSSHPIRSGSLPDQILQGTPCSIPFPMGAWGLGSLYAAFVQDQPPKIDQTSNFQIHLLFSYFCPALP